MFICNCPNAENNYDGKHYKKKQKKKQNICKKFIFCGKYNNIKATKEKHINQKMYISSLDNIWILTNENQTKNIVYVRYCMEGKKRGKRTKMFSLVEEVAKLVEVTLVFLEMRQTRVIVPLLAHALFRMCDPQRSDNTILCNHHVDVVNV